ncbi:MAG: hypothetical protein QOE98_1163 [Gaiellaceae bacterium]|jgi:hypothetical protein|nr:hypothetical protein [Gaiellaceae bacterium]
MLRSLGLASLVSLLVPSVAGAAEATKLGEEKVTQAMFVLIIALVLLLALAVALEQRKWKDH